MVLQTGLRDQPNSVEMRMALAAIFERLGQYNAAVDEYERLLSLQPGSMIAANNLAISWRWVWTVQRTARSRFAARYARCSLSLFDQFLCLAR